MTKAERALQAKKKAKEEGYCHHCLSPSAIPTNGRLICDKCRKQRALYSGNLRAYRRLVGLCVDCSNPVFSNTTRCSKCWDKKYKTRKQLRRERARSGLCIECGVSSPTYRCSGCYARTPMGPSFYRSRVDTSKCVVCGFTAVVEVHHRDKDRSNNDLNNLVPLCPNCHSMIHKKLIHCP